MFAVVESHVYGDRRVLFTTLLPDIQDIVVLEKNWLFHARRMDKEREVSDISFDLRQAKDVEESKVANLFDGDGFAGEVEIRALGAFVQEEPHLIRSQLHVSCC
jgi:hypothetical protein